MSDSINLQQILPESIEPRPSRQTNVPAAVKNHAGRVLLLILVISALPRLLAIGSIPLLISNDGVWYLQSADALYRGHWPEVPTLRTPGYPLFIAGVFHIVGRSPLAVLLVNHLMAVATALLVTLCALRWSKPLPALLAGVLCGLDPWIFGYENYALTETISLFLFAAIATMVLCVQTPRATIALMVGLLLGFATLVRPAFQITIPFLILAWILSFRASRRRRATLAVIALIGVFVVLGPWLRYNFRRGIHGVATGFSGMQWQGLAINGLLDWSFPRDADVDKLIEPFRKGDRMPLDPLTTLVSDMGGNGPRAGFLSAWNCRSILARPKAFLKTSGYSLCWQLGVFPESGGLTHDDLSWFVWRSVQNGDNDLFEVPHSRVGLQDYYMYGEGGWLRRLVSWWYKHRIPGCPHVFTFACVLAVTLVSLLRRQWTLAFTCIAALVFFLIHVSILVPVGRYTMPMWSIFYISPAIALGGFAQRQRQTLLPTPSAQRLNGGRLRLSSSVQDSPSIPGGIDSTPDYKNR